MNKDRVAGWVIVLGGAIMIAAAFQTGYIISLTMAGLWTIFFGTTVLIDS